MAIDLDTALTLMGASGYGLVAVYVLFRYVLQSDWYDEFRVVQVLGFGGIWVPYQSNNYWQLAEMRKCKPRQWCVTAPKWFNVHVWNVGGKV